MFCENMSPTVSTEIPLQFQWNLGIICRLQEMENNGMLSITAGRNVLTLKSQHKCRTLLLALPEFAKCFTCIILSSVLTITLQDRAAILNPTFQGVSFL